MYGCDTELRQEMYSQYRQIIYQLNSLESFFFLSIALRGIVCLEEKKINGYCLSFQLKFFRKNELIISSTVQFGEIFEAFRIV